MSPQVVWPGALLVAGRTNRLASIGNESWLTETETRRSDRLLSASDRHDYVTAHLLIRVVAGLFTGLEPHDVRVRQHCHLCGGDGHGRPTVEEVPGVCVSLSHTPGYVAAVAGPCDVAVDVQAVSELDIGDLGNVVLTSAEQDVIREAPDPIGALGRVWTRKEALIKLGVVSLDSLTLVDVAVNLNASRTDMCGLVVDGWSTRAGDVVGTCISKGGVIRHIPPLDLVSSPAVSGQ